jgi:hypothetical protein
MPYTERYGMFKTFGGAAISLNPPLSPRLFHNHDRAVFGMMENPAGGGAE